MNIQKRTFPLITIGITCFNAQDTIVRAIESAQQQDWLNFEIIVVDDCSDDQSVAAIEAILLRYNNIRLVKHEVNKGYPAALNTIISHAAGEYIAFFDDDDDARTDRLTKQYKRLKDFLEVNADKKVLCYSDRKVFVNGQEKPEGYVKAIGRTEVFPRGEAVADFILWHHQAPKYCWGEFGSCTLMAKTTDFKKYQFDEAFRRCAEWDFAIRFALDGGVFIAVDEPLISQYKTLTEDKAGKKPLQYGLLLRQKHKSFLKSKRLYLSSIMQAYCRYYYFIGQKWRSRTFLILSCLFSPDKVLISEVRKRTN